jgi:hypothetical protein
MRTDPSATPKANPPEKGPPAAPPATDRFLSEEDLDLANLGEAELYAYWNAWLLQAQATNDEDRDRYSHGVFTLMREPRTPRQDAALRSPPPK